MGRVQRRKAYRTKDRCVEVGDVSHLGPDGIEKHKAKRVIVRPDLLGKAGGTPESRKEFLVSGMFWDYISQADRDRFVKKGEIINTEGGKKIFRYLCRFNGINPYKSLEKRLNSIDYHNRQKGKK